MIIKLCLFAVFLLLSAAGAAVAIDRAGQGFENPQVLEKMSEWFLGFLLQKKFYEKTINQG